MSRSGQNQETRVLSEPINFRVPPYRLHMHSHQQGQLVYVHRGKMTLGLQDGAWAVFGPSLCWLPAYTPHHGGALTSFTGTTIWESELPKLRFPAKPCRLAIPAELSLEKLITSRRQTMFHTLARLLHAERTEAFELALPQSPALFRLATAIMRSPHEFREIDRVAAHLGLSRRTFTRRFRAETNLAFGEWHRLLASSCAEALHRDGTRVSVLAQQLGYNSVSAFVAMYRRTRGYTLNER